MNAAPAKVLAELAAAFPARRIARFDPMANSTQGDEPLLTATAFSDKDDWTKLDAAWLDEAPNGEASALSFLSDEAVCFYIPAFIAADLRGELQRAEPIFHLTHGLADFSRDQRMSPQAAGTWTDHARQRWSHLTTDQALAIVHYLEWRVSRDGKAVACDAFEALSAFWYDRATPLPNVR